MRVTSLKLNFWVGIIAFGAIFGVRLTAYVYSFWVGVTTSMPHFESAFG